MNSENLRQLEELRMRWLVHDELFALSTYVSLFGLEDGLQQRLNDLRGLLDLHAACSDDEDE